MARFFRFFIALAMVLYPAIIFLGYNNMQRHSANFVIVLLLSLRVFFFRESKHPTQKLLNIISAVMIVLIVVGQFLVIYDFTLFYPVMVNYGLMTVFSMSLRKGQRPLIEQLARLTDKNLPAQAIPYTRNVTLVWCVFFLFNGSIALFTSFKQDLRIWTFYNAFLSYILIGLLLGGEFVFRHFYKLRWYAKK